ncbi:phosphatase PAP2 family protein [Actinobacteria bacterium YIM 96077]|uniref:Phosphatidic acid phosphatase type 2/haloperoxidase domain-containing protein n=1 Tax=Phytoactinopolyspora halophila TaxID=1981511 RepID=A0A329QSP4_9ACTN|nr:phosphatase PAP2 family protein [Phytoactinopolyspora halophila]AYY14887.1 phosphatase PAP2 family protein [Actinobacteria bacterium YIM 96077]RAW15345.1 hypothetical protein DPM12_08810 [Phytoactinopolyspora halophila]
MEAATSGRTNRGLYAGLAAGTAGAVVLATVGLLLDDHLPLVDVWALDVLRTTQGEPAYTVVTAVSDGLGAVCVGGAAAAIAWLVWQAPRHAWRLALGYVLLFLLLAGSAELLKAVFARPHPVGMADWSFPSAHVAIVATATLITVGILGRLITRWRRHLVMLAVIVVAVIAVTRVWLGEHHVTDVVATAAGYAGLGYAGLRLLDTWLVARSVDRAP